MSHRSLHRISVAIILCVAWSTISRAEQAQQTKPNRAVTPESGMKNAKWRAKHEAINERVKQGNVDVIFVGDSHSGGWKGQGKELWKKYYEPRNAANLGVGGDQTQHVLWRLDNGNIDGISPKLAIVEIGANNIHFKQTPEQVTAGIKAIVDKLREKFPNAKILILGLFPRGPKADDPFRALHAETNKLAARLADDKMVFFLDITPKFLNPDGTFRDGMLNDDNLHFSSMGYKVWAESMEPTMVKLLGENAATRASTK